MTVSITAGYGALVALLYLALSLRVVMYRRTNRISLGDAGDPALLSRIRAHGNLAEYAPLALVLLLTAEIGGSAPWVLHLGGGMLLGGRLAHAVSLSFPPTGLPLRTIGMTLTFLSIGWLAVAAVAA
jgi:uncharacterized membrane protein YecN with MAPEG domain